MNTSRAFRTRLLLAGSSVAMVALLAACSAGPHGAALEGQAKGSSATETRAMQLSPRVAAVEDVALAWRLAAYGQRTDSPLLLIAAAQILLESPAQPLGVEPGVEDDPEAALARPEPEASDLGAAPLELLARAEEMAAGNLTLLALIEQLRPRAGLVPRGARGLPRHRRDTLRGEGTAVYGITFLGGDPAVVRVTGGGDAPFDLRVYDDAGRLVGSDARRLGDVTVTWLPQQTRRFRIELRNLDRAPHDYTIITN